MKIANFGVEEWLNVWENDAIYDIAGSSIASMTLEEIINIGDLTKDEFFAQCLEKKMNYGWIEGSPEFKKEVSELYKTVKPKQVLQTNGATGANLLAILGLINPDDHVISLHPSYQQLYEIPRALGADVDLWECTEKAKWMPDLDQLRKLVKPNTKMICINNANNPTGTIMENGFLMEIIKIADEVGAYVLSDEVYKPLTESVKVSSIVDLYERGISTNSLSKTYSVPGVRVGWIVANEEIINDLKKYRDYTMICAGVLDDAIATYVLRNKNAVLERNKKIVDENLQILKEWVNQESRVSLIFPKNVSTSFIKLDIPIPTEDFCVQLLKDKGVLLVPGERFDSPGFARLGYCAHKEVLINGLRGLSEFLRQFD